MQPVRLIAKAYLNQNNRKRKAIGCFFILFLQEKYTKELREISYIFWKKTNLICFYKIGCIYKQNLQEKYTKEP